MTKNKYIPICDYFNQLFKQIFTCDYMRKLINKYFHLPHIYKIQYTMTIYLLNFKFLNFYIQTTDDI